MMKMKSTITSIILLLLSVVATPSSSTIIENCNPTTSELCATTSNRTCYNYTSTSTHECSTCLNGFIEYDDNCYSIAELRDAHLFTILSELIERFTPEYADLNVSTEERAERLVEVAKVISYWDSFVPPVLFQLRLNEESTLTMDERKMRLGVNSAIRFDLEGVDGEGRRGRLERFIVEGINDDNDELIGTALDEEDTDNIMAAAQEGGSEEVDSTNNPTFRRLAAAASSNNNNKKQAHRRMQDNPPAIDWHKSGYTTKVKNQGYCGCCYAVSVTAAIESALMITNKTSRVDALTTNSLSFQQMISCDEKNLACDGGNILYAAKYAWEHNDFSNDHYGGLVSYEDYPYEDLFGLKDSRTCKTAGKTPVAFLNFPKVVTSVNDRSGFEERRDLMITAVAQQPVPMTLMSNCNLFMSYSGGVLTHDNGCECCEVSCIDHAVVIVGYNTTHDPPYWKIRNSWGSGWGEAGHVRVAMNQPGCGWGLFGLLSEGALLEDVYTSKEDLPERPSWWQTSSTGAKVLVILASLLGVLLLSSVVGTCAKKCRKSE
mmetsp:Transcript_15470/g.21977  ORF Transcript_15470/g.21977 Transcript_15470/m.21977 type:complete len:546 (-) Transcript_15470:1510-3147(-)